MKNRRNYYRILHVQPDAPREIIKASYRTLMQKLKHHPDLGGDEWDASILNEAYATLTNEKRRAAYDRQVLHRIKSTPARDHGKRQAKDTNSARETTKSQEYWKNPSLCPFCGSRKPARSDYNSSSFNCSRCNSPLDSVVQLEISGLSKRKLERIINNTTVRIYTSPAGATAIPGLIRNLSPRGMQLVISANAANGQVVRIDSDVLSAIARVCYCQPEDGTGRYLIGVKFLTAHFLDQRGSFFSASA